jgi:hypothetical protein
MLAHIGRNINPAMVINIFCFIFLVIIQYSPTYLKFVAVVGKNPMK